MSAWEWLGLVGTFVFGGISVFQLVRELINRKVRQTEAAHLHALGNSLAHLRMMCSEAIQTGEIIKTDASKQFVRQIAYSLLTAEAHVDAIERSFRSDKKITDKPTQFLTG